MTDPLREKREALVKVRKRFDATASAHDSLIEYMRLTMPDPNDPDDVSLTKYQITPQARLLCQIMEKVERRELKRVAISIGPQMGKSQVLSRGAPAWMSGRDPSINLILGSYNQDFANEFGDDVRALVKSSAHRQVFPDHQLRVGGEGKKLLISDAGGKMAFVGVGGSGTGKPADVFIIDDPVKGDEDAQSDIFRERVWNWFTKVANTRIHNNSAIVIVHCLTGDTLVLLVDGSEKPIRDIRPGDTVATYDAGELKASVVRNWRSCGFDKVFKIKTASGVTVRANERHPFLVHEGGKQKWTRTRDLRRGHAMFRVNGENGKASRAVIVGAIDRLSAEDIASRTTIKSDGRMGFGRLLTTLESAGRLISNAATGYLSRITTGCRPDRAVFAPSAASRPKKMSGLIGAASCASTTVTPLAGSEDYSVTTVISQSDTQKLPRSPDLWWNTCDFTLDEIIEITEVGVEEVFDIQVDRTENFIANGFVSHNTRWNEDDLIGRVCDPDHPERKKKYDGIADEWTYINIPAVVTDPKLAAALGLTLEVPTEPLVVKQFGTKPIAALWPEKFSLNFLASQKRLDKQGFTALRMGKPSPEDGDFFKATDIVEYYSPAELPTNLRKYGASDHATSEKQKNDATVAGCVGIDEDDNIWVLPDLFWDRVETDRTVEELLYQFKTHKPLLWWMESELISKSFGPFLHKRMLEERIYTSIDPVTPAKDKKMRARSIQGRMQRRKVRFPAFAPWWPDMRNQLLKFPYGAKDDTVDWLAHIGMGLMKEVGATKPKVEDDNVIQVGSMAWVLAQTKLRARKEKSEKAAVGW